MKYVINGKLNPLQKCSTYAEDLLARINEILLPSTYNDPTLEAFLSHWENNDVTIGMEPAFHPASGEVLYHESLTKFTPNFPIIDGMSPFIPTLQKYNLFELLDVATLEMTLQVTRQTNIETSKNIEPAALNNHAHNDILTKCECLFEEYKDIMPLLTIEIIERDELSDHAISWLKQQQEYYGFSIALDDLGSTGAHHISNTDYLNKLLRSFGDGIVLKIDRDCLRQTQMEHQATLNILIPDDEKPYQTTNSSFPDTLHWVKNTKRKHPSAQIIIEGAGTLDERMLLVADAMGAYIQSNALTPALGQSIMESFQQTAHQIATVHALHSNNHSELTPWAMAYMNNARD